MILLSACLAGENCRFNGGNCFHSEFHKLYLKKKVYLVCPEELGGLPTPREPAEIMGGSGEEVLEGKTRILDREGKDVTKQYLKGARKVLRIAKKFKIKKAILKSYSSSCGIGQIYDGRFSGNLKKGNGVTSALLLKEKIEIISDGEYLKREIKSSW